MRVYSWIILLLSLICLQLNPCHSSNKIGKGNGNISEIENTFRLRHNKEKVNITSTNSRPCNGNSRCQHALDTLKSKILESLSLRRFPEPSNLAKSHVDIQNFPDLASFESPKDIVKTARVISKAEHQQDFEDGRRQLMFALNEREADSEVFSAYLRLFTDDICSESLQRELIVRIWRVGSANTKLILYKSQIFVCDFSHVDLDVTDLIKGWISEEIENNGVALNFTGLEHDVWATAQDAYLITDSVLPRRIKRSGATSVCGENETTCCRSSVEVNLADIVGMDFIIPTDITMYYCKGDCPHTMLRPYGRMHNRHNNDYYRPCCVPTPPYSPILIIYQVFPDSITAVKIHDVIVEKCGCL